MTQQTPYTNSSYPPEVAKGQILTIPELEKLLGIVHADCHDWGFRLLSLKQRIYQDRKNRGLPAVTIRSEHDRLVICTDSEAAAYNRSMGKRGLRKFSRAAARNQAVDATKLSEQEQQAHQHSLKRQAMLMRAMRSAQRAALPAPAAPPERVTPRMLETSEN